MCTSVEQAEKMKQAVRAGADEYVTKPFDEDDLLDTATMLLN
jgi:two-component system chemotaxis response regulator CheY